ADVARAGERALAEPAGIAGEGGLCDGLAIPGNIDAHAETRHDRVRIGGDDSAGGLAAHALVAHAEIRGDTRAGAPAILEVERQRIDVDRGPARRNPVRDACGRRGRRCRVAIPERDRLAVAADDRTSAGREIVGVEDVAGGRLRVAAGAERLVVL